MGKGHKVVLDTVKKVKKVAHKRCPEGQHQWVFKRTALGTQRKCTRCRLKITQVPRVTSSFIEDHPEYHQKTKKKRK